MTQRKLWRARLGIMCVILVMVVSNFITAVPVFLNAAENPENITVSAHAVTAGTQVKATITGAAPTATQQQVLTLSGQGLTFDLATSQSKGSLAHNGYRLSTDGKTLTLQPGQTMPLTVYLNTENTGEAERQGTLEATASGTVAATITQTITIQPKPNATPKTTIVRRDAVAQTAATSAMPAQSPGLMVQHRMQYVAGRDDGDTASSTGATPIDGAALPTLPNMLTITAGGESYSGLSGVIMPYSQRAQAATTTTPATANGDGTYQADSSMMTSAFVSGTSDSAGSHGMAMFQQLWLQTPLPASTTKGDLYSQIKQAISEKRLLGPQADGSGYLDYAIKNPAMMGRATATPAKDYYTFAQTMNVFAKDNSYVNLGGSVVQTNAQYATNDYGIRGNTFIIALQKVKKVTIQDTAGSTLTDFKALFKSTTGGYMVTTADGELVPANADGTVKTDGFFAWPSGQLRLVSLTDSDGDDIMPAATGGAISLDVKTDHLSMATPVAGKAEVQDDGKTIHYQVPTAALKLHVGGIAAGDQVTTAGIQDAKFTITDLAHPSWRATGMATAEGTITFKLPSGLKSGTFKLTQDASQVPGYSHLNHDFYFHWTAASGVDEVATAVSGTSLADAQTTSVALSDGGVLTRQAGLAVGLPQRLMLSRSDLATPEQPLAVGQFTVQEVAADGTLMSAMTSQVDQRSDGQYALVSLSATADPATIRVFKVTAASDAPSPYLNDTTAYYVTYSGAKGVIGVGQTYQEAVAQTGTADLPASVQPTTLTDVGAPELRGYNLGLAKGVERSLAFTNVPTAGKVLNFGSNEATATSIGLKNPLDATDTRASATFGGQTPQSTMATEGMYGQRFSISMRQTGDYPEGWHLTLAGQPLVAEANNAATIQGAISFGSGLMTTPAQLGGAQFVKAVTTDPSASVTLDGTPTTLASATMYDGTPLNTPGNYTAMWDPKNIKLNVPAGAAHAGNYRADLTWTLVVDTKATQ